MSPIRIPAFAYADLPFTHCPSFDRCSVNACPLDPDYHQHVSEPEDSEKKCRAHKPTRLKLVERLREEGNPALDGLPFGGLTAKEEAGRKRAEAFAQLPEEERERRLEILRRARLQLSAGNKPLSELCPQETTPGDCGLVSGTEPHVTLDSVSNRPELEVPG